MDREPMTKDKERDALIAEARKNLDGTAHGINEYMREVLRLERSGDEQPKPDRAEVLADELLQSPKYWPGYAAIIRRHFDELRAEWEAERQDEPVCFIGKVDCDGNELVTVSKDALDRYKDQARYTYQRAEKAEARVKKLEAERPAVVVPSEAKLWAESRLNKRSAVPLNYGEIAAQYILNGAKGGE